MKTNFRNYTNSDRQELVEQTYKKCIEPNGNKVKRLDNPQCYYLSPL
jgi:hypothetical protein